MLDASGPNLVARAQEGDVDAIGALYDQHHESIFRYVWLRVGDRHLAEDLTGDVFMRMLNALPDYRSIGLPFRAWLYRIAHNLLIDHYRKIGNHPALPLEVIEDQHADEADPPAAAEHTLLVERLEDALSKMEPGQRDVVTLRFVSGLSLRETALVLDKTEAAVKSLQHRGLAALRLTMSQEQQVN